MRSKVWVAASILIGVTALTFTPTTHGQEKVRLNKLIELLEQKKTVFGAFGATNDPESAMQMVKRDLDFVYYVMEHKPDDIFGLRAYMQFMIDPVTILKRGRVVNDYPMVVMSPPYGRGTQSFVSKVLDSGAFGISTALVETPEQGLNAIRAMRYPQSPGAPDFEPQGRRSIEPGLSNAMRLWNVSREEYFEKADVWPLDPNGELVSMFMIETPLGVKNVREIVQVKGLTAIAVGPGDLRFAYEGDDAKIEAAMQAVLAAAKEFNVPAVCLHCFGEYMFPSAEQRIKEGWRVIVGRNDDYLKSARKFAGR